MKRLIKNSIYLIIIASILFLAAQTYEGGSALSGSDSGDLWGDFPATIPAEWRRGTSPQEDISYIADLMHVRYPDNIAITGIWRTSPFDGTDYVIYEVNLDYTSAKNLIDIESLENLEDMIIGELAIATARKRVVSTSIPGIEKNVLNEMAIYVSRANVPRRHIDEDPNRIAESTPRIDEELGKVVYVFERDAIIGLSEETNPLNWPIYAKSLTYDYKLPNS